jgi:peptide/nickel transport system permease protein
VGKYILKRIFQSVPLVLVVLAINFVIIHTAPGDAVTYLYGPSDIPAEELEKIRISLGLRDPIYKQFGDYITRLLKGDFGYSYIYEKPVLSLILERLPASLLLTFSGFGFSLLFGVFLGTLAAIKSRSVVDYIISTASVIGYCTPVFWLGIILILVFSLHLDIFPSMGIESLGADYTGFSRILDIMHHLVLPGITLGAFYMATYARLTRASTLEVLDEDFIQTARAKGLSDFVVYYKHALKNALLPVVTVIGMHIGLILMGAILTETVFAWPGMGRLTYSAILQRDYPLLMGMFVFIAWCVIVANLLADILYTMIDPRIRYE